jgi:hypothetical protein
MSVQAERRAQALELLAFAALASAAFAALPLHAGLWGWSWDALNHHVYLGYISEQPRWQLDVQPASVQSWQYPYLYWPVYRLSLLPISGAWAGALWAVLLVSLLLPPLWLCSLRLLHTAETPAQGVFERAVACVLGLGSAVVVSSTTTTANDPLAAVPVLWAVALMAVPEPGHRRAAAAAALWGVACAFKLSNALALPLLLVWWWQGSRRPLGLRRAVALTGGAVLGFAGAYAPWGWQLWQQTGNPFYPFFQQWLGG